MALNILTAQLLETTQQNGYKGDAMTEAVIVALVTGGFTLVGTTITALIMNSKTLYRIDQLENNQKELLQELKLKQAKHNEVIERMFTIEKDVKILDERVKEVEGDIKELKSK